MSYKKIYTLWILIAIMKSSLQASVNDFALHLELGESRVVQGYGNNDISISKKGIIDLIAIENGRYKITGHKSGFVFIKGVRKDQRILVYVHGGALSHDFPQWICKKLKCDKHKVLGISESFEDFYHARQIVKRQKKFIFMAELSHLERKKLRLNLLKMHPNLKISVRKSGVVIFYYQKFNKKGLVSAVERSLDTFPFKIPFSIVESPEEHRQFKVTGSLELKVMEQSDSIGLGDDLPILKFIQKKPVINGGKFIAENQNNSGNVLTKPTLILTDGSTGLAESGGEFSAPLSNGGWNMPVHWKKYGTRLEVTVSEVGKNVVSVHVDFSYKNLSKKGGNMQLHHIKTTVLSKLDQKMLLGTIIQDSYEDSKVDISILSQIPIVGPLFGGSHTHKIRATVGLWLAITEFKYEPLV